MQEFDKELTGAVNAVMWVSSIIAVLGLGAIIINKFYRNSHAYFISRSSSHQW
ncbi:UNVERIFIED_ORG: hypothetical protein [Escherichia phage CMSTMSU]